MAQAQQTLVRVPLRYSLTWKLPTTMTLVGSALVLAFLLLTAGIFQRQPTPVAVPQFVAEATATPTVVPTATIVPTPKIRIEWIKVGIARNGIEAIALGLPSGDYSICIPVEVVDNLPPGATGLVGVLTERETVIPVTAVETTPWVFTYWKGTEEIPYATIKGLCP